MKTSNDYFSTNKRRLKHIALVAIFAAVTGWWWYLLDSGFCFSQMRYLSEKDLIVEAIRHNSANMKLDETEDSIGAFLQENPKCCHVERHPSSRNFLGPLGVCLGFNYSEVTLNYEQRKPHFLAEPFYEKHLSISACGQSLHDEYGMGHPTLQKIN